MCECGYATSKFLVNVHSFIQRQWTFPPTVVRRQQFKRQLSGAFGANDSVVLIVVTVILTGSITDDIICQNKEVNVGGLPFVTDKRLGPVPTEISC